MKLVLAILFSITLNSIFSQLEFTSQKRLLFLGSDSIECKKIIAGVYITPIDSFNLHLQLDILDDWKQKDSISIDVHIDTSSILNNKFYIFRHDSFPCYRFYDTTGFEIYIQKERVFDSYDQYGSFIRRSYTVHFVQLFLPEKKKFYVKTLPLMFKK